VLQYVGDLDWNKIHVQAPTQVIFVCGGQYSAEISAPPLSLRDAFLKINNSTAIKNPQLIQAEEVTKASFFSDHYPDLLTFETDLAQTTGLVLLFCEGIGSLAELGSFVMVDAIESRLLVIVRNKHWDGPESFVRLGPLRHLEKRYGNQTIFVIDDSDIGIEGDSPAKIKTEVLGQLLKKPLLDRLKETHDRTTLDKTKTGHVIKLIVGLIQEYGALTIDEIVGVITHGGIKKSPEEMERYLLCAKAVKWIAEIRKGSTTFYVARNLPDDAAFFRWKGTATLKNRLRRRALIRAHWKNADEPRHRAIERIFSGEEP
jgi:hypothetical protein